MINKYNLQYHGDYICIFVEKRHEKLIECMNEIYGSRFTVKEILLEYIDYMVRDVHHTFCFVKNILQNSVGRILMEHVEALMNGNTDFDSFFESDIYSSAQRTMDAQVGHNDEWIYKQVSGSSEAQIPKHLWPLKDMFK